MPSPGVVDFPPVVFDVSMQLASIFGAVTMTDYVVHQLQPSMQDSPAKRPYSNPIASWRKNIAFAYQPIVLVLLLLSGPAFGYVWMKTSWREAGPFLWITTVFVALTSIRIAALAYGAVFFGPFTSRLAFSTYAIAVMLAPLILIEASKTARIGRQPP